MGEMVFPDIACHLSDLVASVIAPTALRESKMPISAGCSFTNERRSSLTMPGSESDSIKIKVEVNIEGAILSSSNGVSDIKALKFLHRLRNRLKARIFAKQQ